MLNKKDRMKTSKLSSTVLDYYYKYGQNRDLEKYLRLKRQSTSKSSSDSSLRNYAGGDSTTESRRITKSMDQLDLSDRHVQIEDDFEHIKSNKNENIGKSNRDESIDKPINDNKHIKIEKKTQQQWTGKSKSKSYNFNLESSIEIALPTTTSMPILPTMQTIDTISKPTQTLQWESCETQTEPFDGHQSGPSNLIVQTPLIVSSAIEPKTDPMKPTPENMPDTSPASSVASAKVRLEWDSMADIGYNRIIDFKSQSNSNLTTFERSALTKFFAKRGLNFDDNLVILAPVEKRSPLQKHEFTQSAIEMRDAQKIRKQLPNLSPSTNKHVWERALMKYREKYGKSKVDGVSGIDATHFMAPHHSTPISNELNQNSGLSSETIDQSYERNIKIIPESSTKKQCFEKWCQTSSVDVEAIGIQVEQPEIHRISKSVQIEIEQVHESTQKDDEDLTIATSFEFLAPSAYKTQQASDRLPAVSQPIQPPLIPPMPGCSTMTNDIPKCDDTKHDIYADIENPNEKENIPPIEDKENIPPPTLHTMPRTDQPSTFKTPEKIAEKSIDQSVLPNDLQKGVDLINALIDSRGTDSETKKKLIRKIVRYLLKSRDTKDITQMILSFSGKSKSQSSSLSTSTELENSARTKHEKTAKDSISGVSTLSSSSSNESKLIEAQQKRPQKCEPNELKNVIETPPQSGKNGGEICQNNQNRIEIKNEECRMKDGISKEEVREWLLPATQSEINKENARKLQLLHQIDTKPMMHSKMQQRINNKNSKCGDKSPRTNDIFEFLEHEKKTHFNWIEQEIQHLKNLKLLLNQLDGSDNEASRDDVSDEQINSVYAKHNRDFLTIYENFRRNRKPVSGNGSRADISSTLIDSSRSSDDTSNSLNRGKIGSKSHWIHKTTLESPPSTISSGSKLKYSSARESMEQIKSKTSNRLPVWDSHLNMQQLVKNRTKLKTPNSDDSIDAYATVCRSKFQRKSTKSTANDPMKKDCGKKNAPEPPIYTKPYSSDSYSYLSNIHRSKEDRLKQKHKNNIANAYTSDTESDGFLSPNSISIGVAANSTSNTTTHQYDTKISIGLQTTNTLKRMPIIQMKKPAEIPVEPVTHDDPPTIRVNKLTVNKQLQVRPESLAYIIVFNEKDEHNNGNGSSMGQERGNQLYANSGGINSTAASSDNNDLNYPKSQNKQTNFIKQSNQFSEQVRSNSSSGTSVENLTLQEYLQIHRPDFYANAEHRRKCLIDLHNLRLQRNEQRKKLLAMNICSNAKMLNRNMKRLLPPPPLAQMRIFKTKEIISQTRRKYQRLPEIRQRQQMERDMKIRRNHRILVNMFSKNLQKHVLSGKTDLSNSMMIN